VVKRKHLNPKDRIKSLEMYFGLNRRVEHLVLVAESSSLQEIIAEAVEKGYVPSCFYGKSSNSEILSDLPNWALPSGYLDCNRSRTEDGRITSERVNSRSKDIVYRFYTIEPNLTPTASQTDKSL